VTEEEWLASNDPYPMLHPCRKVIRYCPRKGHLFAVACCRRIWHLFTDPRSRAAVETTERFIEGEVDRAELAVAAHDESFRRRGKVAASTEWAAQFTASENAWHAASRASNFAYVAAGDGLQPGPEHTAQAHLLRDIFGNPFRPVTADPSWLTPTVTALAAAIYADRAFDRLPILADALEEAGCDHPDVLAHCRGPGPHVRGCWVVDLLLGKT
jgi:hypothetical protein